MMLDVQDKVVSAKQGAYLATARATICDDAHEAWAVHAWIGERQMVSAFCELDRTDAIRACKLLVRWLANRSSSLAGGAMEKPQTESPKGNTTWKGEFVARAGELENPPKPQAVPCRLPPAAPGTCPPSGGMASGENRDGDLGRRSATELRTPRKRCGFEPDGCGLARGHGESSTLTPPESGCERDYGTHRVTGGELPTRVDKMPPRMAALAAPFPEPDRQPDVGRPLAVTLAVSE